MVRAYSAIIKYHLQVLIFISSCVCISAAGLAVAEAIDNDGILNNVIARGEQIRSYARDIKTRIPGVIQDIRGWGLINGIELTESSGVTAADVAKLVSFICFYFVFFAFYYEQFDNFTGVKRCH